MKDMKRSERMARTMRIVNKRKNIIKYIFKSTGQRLYTEEGRLRKYNFTCSCTMCRSIKQDKKSHIKSKYRWFFHDVEE